MTAVHRQLILMIILAAILPFTPWWMAILVCAADGYFSICQKCAALRGGIALGIVWIGMVIIRYIEDAEILMNRVAEMMGFGSGIYLFLVIAALGIMLGGLSGYTGSLLRLQFTKESY